VIIHSYTAQQHDSFRQFGLFQIIIRPYLFQIINKNVACSKVFIALSPELSIKLCLHVGMLQAKFYCLISRIILKTLPAPWHVNKRSFYFFISRIIHKTLPASKHVASKVFVVLSPELSIKTMPAPRHVASKVFVDNSGRDNA
jgi:hypothetical protein